MYCKERWTQYHQPPGEMDMVLAFSVFMDSGISVTRSYSNNTQYANV